MRRFDFGTADNASRPHTYVCEIETGITVAVFYFDPIGQRWAEMEAELLAEVLNR